MWVITREGRLTWVITAHRGGDQGGGGGTCQTWVTAREVVLIWEITREGVLRWVITREGGLTCVTAREERCAHRL